MFCLEHRTRHVIKFTSPKKKLCCVYKTRWACTNKTFFMSAPAITNQPRQSRGAYTYCEMNQQRRSTHESFRKEQWIHSQPGQASINFCFRFFFNCSAPPLSLADDFLLLFFKYKANCRRCAADTDRTSSQGTWELSLWILRARESRRVCTGNKSSIINIGSLKLKCGSLCSPRTWSAAAWCMQYRLTTDLPKLFYTRPALSKKW